MQRVSDFRRARHHQGAALESVPVPATAFTFSNLRKALRSSISARLESGDFARWSVTSATVPGKRYAITLSHDGFGFAVLCACPAGRHAKPCKHGMRVLITLGAHPWAHEAARLAAQRVAVPMDVRALALAALKFAAEVEAL